LWRQQHAAHRRVSHAAVAKAPAIGRISTEPDGPIDRVKADRQWEAATDPAKQCGLHLGSWGRYLSRRSGRHLGEAERVDQILHNMWPREGAWQNCNQILIHEGAQEG